MFMLDDATAASSGADQPDPAQSAQTPADPPATPAPAADPTPAPAPAWPAEAEALQARIDALEELIDRKISEAIAGMGAQLAAIRAMIVSPAEIDAFVDRKIAAIPTPAAALPAPAPGPGPTAPASTHSPTAGNVGATGAHGDLGANKA